MIKYFTKAFKITNENIILATPLILGMLLLSLYLGVTQKTTNETPAYAVLLLLTLLLMLSAFFAGWFYIVKKAIELDKKEFVIEEEKAKASFGLIKEFPIGIGEYFLSFIGAVILYFTMILLCLFCIYQIGIHLIGSPDVDLLRLKMALISSVEMKSLVSSFSAEQLAKINSWFLLFFCVMTAFSFLTMFWVPQILKTKNPFIALFKSIGFLFKNFLPAVILFIYISIINVLVSLMNTISVTNSVLYFFSMLIYFYFVVYVVVLIFLYYDSEEQSKTEDNCDSGPDSIGQEQICDSNGNQE